MIAKSGQLESELYEGINPISFGFQEDFVEGFIRRTVHSQEISGWLSIGRTVSAGNIQYTFLGYRKWLGA